MEINFFDRAAEAWNNIFNSDKTETEQDQLSNALSRRIDSAVGDKQSNELPWFFGPLKVAQNAAGLIYGEEAERLMGRTVLGGLQAAGTPFRLIDEYVATFATFANLVANDTEGILSDPDYFDKNFEKARELAMGDREGAGFFDYGKDNVLGAQALYAAFNPNRIDLGEMSTEERVKFFSPDKDMQEGEDLADYLSRQSAVASSGTLALAMAIFADPVNLVAPGAGAAAKAGTAARAATKGVVKKTLSESIDDSLRIAEPRQPANQTYLVSRELEAKRVERALGKSPDEKFVPYYTYEKAKEILDAATAGDKTKTFQGMSQEQSIKLIDEIVSRMSVSADSANLVRSGTKEYEDAIATLQPNFEFSLSKALPQNANEAELAIPEFPGESGTIYQYIDGSMYAINNNTLYVYRFPDKGIGNWSPLNILSKNEVNTLGTRIIEPEDLEPKFSGPGMGELELDESLFDFALPANSALGDIPIRPFAPQSELAGVRAGFGMESGRNLVNLDEDVRYMLVRLDSGAQVPLAITSSGSVYRLATLEKKALSKTTKSLSDEEVDEILATQKIDELDEATKRQVAENLSAREDVSNLTDEQKLLTLNYSGLLSQTADDLNYGSVGVDESGNVKVAGELGTQEEVADEVINLDDAELPMAFHREFSFDPDNFADELGDIDVGDPVSEMLGSEYMVQFDETLPRTYTRRSLVWIPEGVSTKNITEIEYTFINPVTGEPGRAWVPRGYRLTNPKEVSEGAAPRLLDAEGKAFTFGLGNRIIPFDSSGYVAEKVKYKLELIKKQIDVTEDLNARRALIARGIQRTKWEKLLGERRAKRLLVNRGITGKGDIPSTVEEIVRAETKIEELQLTDPIRYRQIMEEAYGIPKEYTFYFHLATTPQGKKLAFIRRTQEYDGWGVNRSYIGNPIDEVVHTWDVSRASQLQELADEAGISTTSNLWKQVLANPNVGAKIDFQHIDEFAEVRPVELPHRTPVIKQAIESKEKEIAEVQKTIINIEAILEKSTGKTEKFISSQELALRNARAKERQLIEERNNYILKGNALAGVNTPGQDSIPLNDLFVVSKPLSFETYISNWLSALNRMFNTSVGLDTNSDWLISNAAEIRKAIRDNVMQQQIYEELAKKAKEAGAKPPMAPVLRPVPKPNLVRSSDDAALESQYPGTSDIAQQQAASRAAAEAAENERLLQEAKAKRLGASATDNVVESSTTAPTSNVIIHSGGAGGADREWAIAADKLGITTKAHSFEGHKADWSNSPKLEERVIHSAKEIEAVHELVREAGIRLGKPLVKTDSFAGKLVHRNAYQVKDSEAVLCITDGFTTLPDGTKTVAGKGTPWAAEQAKILGKPLFNFNQQSNEWFQWNYETSSWDKLNGMPPKYNIFAGVGTRELNESGKKAIEDYLSQFGVEFSTTAPKKVFVFGSNLAGRHGKGAALTAKEKYGAIYGQGEGLQGQSYGIPTKGKNLEVLSLDEIQTYVNNFIDFARKNPDTEFELTAIGTGLAGYAPEQIAPLFVGAPNNVILPDKFKGLVQAPTTSFKTRVVKVTDNVEGSVYVGRPGRGERGEYGNPYPVPQNASDEVIKEIVQQYKEDLFSVLNGSPKEGSKIVEYYKGLRDFSIDVSTKEGRKLLANKILQLDGKALACPGREPADICHANVLIEAIELIKTGAFK